MRGFKVGRFRYVVAFVLAASGVVLCEAFSTGADPAVEAALLPFAVVAVLCGVGPALVATTTSIVVLQVVHPMRLEHLGLVAANGIVVTVLIGLLEAARRESERRTVAEHEAREARDRSIETFERVFASSPLPKLLARAADRTIVAANDAFVEWAGTSREDLIGMPTTIFWELADHDRVRQAQRLFLQAGRFVDFELTATRGGDDIRTLSLTSQLIDVNGVAHALIAFKDLTDERSTQARFEKAFEVSPLPQLLLQFPGGRILAVNAAFERVFGYASTDIIDRTWNEIGLHADTTDRRTMLEAMRRGDVLARGLRLRCHDGSARDVLLSAASAGTSGNVTTTIIVQDVTDELRTTDELRASQAVFARTFRANPLPAGIMRVSDRSWVDINDAFTELFGYTREELVGRSSDNVSLFESMTERQQVLREIQAGNGVRAREVRLRTKDGRVVDALWWTQLIDLQGEASMIAVMQDITERKKAEAALRDSESRFREITDNIKEVFFMSSPDLEQCLYVSPAYEEIWGQSCESLYANPRSWVDAILPEDQPGMFASAFDDRVEQEYRIRRPDGTIRAILVRARAVRDATGEVVRRVGVAQDITQRRLLEDQLRQTQKMESLGMLAGGVAHDFNNVLAVIAACSGMLAETVASGSEDHELVTEIENAVQRASGLTRQLLAFSRRQVVEPKVLDLNAAVNETRKMLRRILGEDILLSTSLDPELARVKVDPGYLVQVLMNFSVNARDAMPRGGTLTISTRNHINGTNRVALEIADTGTGMPPEVVKRIFEPFFTTKEHGRGTGMGLAVVLGIVEQAGGTIEVDSTPGVGTAFRILLPAIHEIAAPFEEVSRALALGNERILLVDDDHHVRRAAARALRTRGYEVVEADDGVTALQQLGASKTVDLLLTDVVMPGMDGRQLAEAARAQQPGLKVLYTSGYTDDAVVRHGVMQGIVDLLEKPFRLDTLAKKVRHVLDA